MKIICSYKSP